MVSNIKKGKLVSIFIILVAVMMLFFLHENFQNSVAMAAPVTVQAKVNPNISVSVNVSSILLEGISGSTITTSNPVVVTVKSNVNYNLSVKATQDLTDASTGMTLPISRLSWAPAGTATWTPFSLSETVIATNEPRTTGGGKSYSFDYQLVLDIDDPAGTYSTDIVYTAVAY